MSENIERRAEDPEHMTDQHLMGFSFECVLELTDLRDAAIDAGRDTEQYAYNRAIRTMNEMAKRLREQARQGGEHE